jgi:hypothetical protein
LGLPGNNSLLPISIFVVVAQAAGITEGTKTLLQAEFQALFPHLDELQRG